MSAERNANATLSELLIKRVQELIIANEEEVVDIRTASGIERGTLKGSEYYRPSEQAKGRAKQLKRDLGALLTSSQEGLDALTAELDKVDLINNPGALGDALSKYLKAKESREVYFRVTRDGTVGHHATATNILRDALAGELSYNKDKTIVKGQIANTKFDRKTRLELFEIAKKNKYNLGADVLAYIDPAAHKEFTTELNGLLQKKFNINTKAGLEQYLNAQELLQRSAHARAFGGTSGIPLPPQLLSGAESAEQIFKIAQPYLDLAKAGSIQGLNMHAVLKNTDWSNPEELLKVLRSEQLTGKIPNTDELLQRIYKSQVDAGIEPSGRLIGAFTDRNLLLPKHRSEFDRKMKAIANLGPNAKGVDVNAIRNADLTPVLDKPISGKIQPGSLASENWSGQSIFYSVTGDGAAALDSPGLFNGAIQDILRTTDGAIPNLPNLDVAKARTFSWMINKGPEKFLSRQASELAFSTPFSLALDKDLREKFTSGDYTGFGTKLAVDHAVGEAVWHGGKGAYGLLPGAVRTIIGKGAGFVKSSIIAPLIKPAAVAAVGVVATGSFTPVSSYSQMTGPHAYYNRPGYKGPKPDDEVDEKETDY